MHSEGRAWRVGIATVLLAAVPVHAVWAQQASAAVRSSCHGETVTAIEVRSLPPSFDKLAERWRTAAAVVDLHHAVTQARVVKAYLLLAVGQRCTERNRAESERLLRAQPYLASAAVRAAGRPSRVAVQTVMALGSLIFAASASWNHFSNWREGSRARSFSPNPARE